MYPEFPILLAAFTMTFLIQYWFPELLLRGKSKILSDVLECSLCLGGHAGWILWFSVVCIFGKFPAASMAGNALSCGIWILACGGFTFLLDTAVKYWVSRTLE